jgi:hypothetical protein
MVGQGRYAPCRTRRTDVRRALIAAPTSCVARRFEARCGTPEGRWGTEARVAGFRRAQWCPPARRCPRVSQRRSTAPGAVCARAARPAPRRSNCPGRCIDVPRAANPCPHGPRATRTAKPRHPWWASACSPRRARAPYAPAALRRASGMGTTARDSRPPPQRQWRSPDRRRTSKRGDA